MLLLGHSHGGVVAAAYAAAHPDRVEKLVLASTLARFAEEQEAAMESGDGDEGPPSPGTRTRARRSRASRRADFEATRSSQELAKREFPFYFAHYGDAERAYLEWLGEEKPDRGRAAALQQRDPHHVFDLRPDLPSITAPTLVITGELDFITGPVCAADFAAIPGPADGAGRGLRPLHPRGGA